MKLPAANVSTWPGQAKAESKLAAVDQSSKASQQGKFRADHQGPVLAGNDPPLVSAESQLRNLKPTFNRACANRIELGEAVTPQHPPREATSTCTLGWLCCHESKLLPSAGATCRETRRS